MGEGEGAGNSRNEWIRAWISVRDDDAIYTIVLEIAKSRRYGHACSNRVFMDNNDASETFKMPRTADKCLAVFN